MQLRLIYDSGEEMNTELLKANASITSIYVGTYIKQKISTRVAIETVCFNNSVFIYGPYFDRNCIFRTFSKSMRARRGIIS